MYGAKRKQDSLLGDKYMKYINFCKEPALFKKVYDAVSETKQQELISGLDEFRKITIDNGYLFNPSISFQDGYFTVLRDGKLIFKVDIREELREKIIIQKDILQDIIYELNMTHGLNVNSTNNAGIYTIDNLETCEILEDLLKDG